ncbi:MAG TPA: nuclear transport factor 2 family protein [Acidimicrobiales bacterium]|nr:nuclear transport factor 2 family protein [Acidimicrobiales bacterium]
MPTVEELAAELAEVRALVDRQGSVLAIMDLKARYGELVDQRFAGGRLVDPERLADVTAQVASLFVEDATWDGGPQLGVATGREAIAGVLRNPSVAFARHYFVKPQIQVDGDRASARWDVFSPYRRPNGKVYMMGGVEDDEYVRRDGTWLHTAMKMTTLFMVQLDDNLKVFG